VNISTIAYLYDLEPKTLHKWYKEQISTYKTDKASGEFLGNKALEVVEQTGEIIKEIPIHIFKPTNIGSDMCIDEKMIGKRYYTILSNQETGKIAFLIGTMNPKVISNGLAKFGELLKIVTRINCDMSPTMKKICTDNFTNAAIVVDKFHVIKHVMDALNTVRLNIKKKLKITDNINKSNPNDWTDLEFLEKTKYLIYKMKSDLEQEQKELLNQLLDKFPTLKEAYGYVEEIRNWYNRANIGKHIWAIEREQDIWMAKLENSKLKEFKIIRKMFDKHQNDINRYFENGASNAKAENLNARIQRFFSNNFGAKDRDFFFFRTQIYFT
jgi:transposase